MIILTKLLTYYSQNYAGIIGASLILGSRLLGHLPGNHKVPGSMPTATVVSLGKKLYFHYLSHPAVKPEHIVYMYQGMAEQQPTWLMPSSTNQTTTKN